jgi:hypothetical protein
MDAGNSELRCSFAENEMDRELVGPTTQGLCSGRQCQDMSSWTRCSCCSPCNGSNNASASSALRSASMPSVWLLDVGGRNGVLEVLLWVPSGVAALLGCRGTGNAVVVYGSEASRASKSGSDMVGERGVARGIPLGE